MRIITLLILFIFLYAYCLPQQIVKEDSLGIIQTSGQDSLSVDLSEIYVTRTLPSLSNHTDRMEMQIRNTALSEAGSVTDILQKAPKIKVDEKYGIYVGIDEASIYVNGREIPDNKVLEMISSKDIEKIEIITNPSVKYDSKAKVIINVTTRSVNKEGLDIDVTGRMTKSEYWNEYIGTDIKAKYSKVSIYGSYAFTPGSKLYKETYSRDIDQDIFKLFVTNNLNTKYNTNNDNRIKGGIQYQINETNNIGADANFTIQKGENNLDNTSKIYLADNMENPLTEIVSNNISNYNRKYTTGSLFHSYRNPSGFRLNTIGDISYYNNEIIQDINESGVGLKNLTNVNEAANRMYVLRTDLNLPLTEWLRLDIGGKYQYKKNNNDNIISTPDNIVYSNTYKYNEKLAALYSFFSIAIYKLTLEGGARIEYVNNKTKTSLFSQDTSRWNIVPNLMINYRFNDYLSLNTSYTMHIHRPAFSDLNPAISYIDSLFFRTGNPALQDEKRHNFQLKMNYRKMSLGFNYICRNNAIVWVMEQVEGKESVTRSTQQNIRKSEIFSLDATIPYIHDYFNVFLATGMIHSKVNDYVSKLSISQTLWYATFNININLPYQMFLNSNHRYFTKGIMNVFYFDPAYRMDLSLKKLLMKKKLSIVCTWNDVFKTDKMKTYTTMNERHVAYNYSYDQASISLSISYNFSIPQ